MTWTNCLFAELEIGVETLFRNDPNPDPCNNTYILKLKLLFKELVDLIVN